MNIQTSKMFKYKPTCNLKIPTATAENVHTFIYRCECGGNLGILIISLNCFFPGWNDFIPYMFSL